MFDEAPSPKVLADLLGGVHTEPTVVGSNKLNKYYAAFLDCHIKGNLDGCWLIYGKNKDECDLCYCDKFKMKKCVT